MLRLFPIACLLFILTAIPAFADPSNPVTLVPEPSALLAFATGIIGFIGLMIRHRERTPKIR